MELPAETGRCFRWRPRARARRPSARVVCSRENERALYSRVDRPRLLLWRAYTG